MHHAHYNLVLSQHRSTATPGAACAPLPLAPSHPTTQAAAGQAPDVRLAAKHCHHSAWPPAEPSSRLSEPHAPPASLAPAGAPPPPSRAHLSPTSPKRCRSLVPSEEERGSGARGLTGICNGVSALAGGGDSEVHEGDDDARVPRFLLAAAACYELGRTKVHGCRGC